jgi:hypothetical protein
MNLAFVRGGIPSLECVFCNGLAVRVNLIDTYGH